MTDEELLVKLNKINEKIQTNLYMLLENDMTWSALHFASLFIVRRCVGLLVVIKTLGLQSIIKTEILLSKYIQIQYITNTKKYLCINSPMG